MLRSDKEKVVAELAEQLRSTDTLIVADYRGLSVPAINKLRGELLEHGAQFTVVKNTLTRRAAEEAGAEALLALLDGPTAIAFLETDGDPVAVAKALNAAVRETRVLEIRGGILDGQQIGQADVANLASLPPTDVLHAQLVSAVSGPLMTVVGLFAAPLRDLVNVIDARIKQLEEQGGAEEASPEAPAGEPELEQEEAAPTEEASSPETEQVSGESKTEQVSGEEETEQVSGEAKNEQVSGEEETEEE
jgi:large subunit ribosomal protein L10